MSYCKTNHYKRALDVVQCHKEHYKEGVTTFIGVWEQYIRPQFYISYSTYRKILEESGLERKYKEALAEEERRKHGKKL